MLYDSRYLAAGMVLFWVSIRGLFLVVSMISSSTLFAYGKPRCETIAMGISLAVLLVLLPLGITHLGMTGALLAILFPVLQRWRWSAGSSSAPSKFPSSLLTCLRSRRPRLSRLHGPGTPP